MPVTGITKLTACTVDNSLYMWTVLTPMWTAGDLLHEQGLPFSSYPLFHSLVHPQLHCG